MAFVKHDLLEQQYTDAGMSENVRKLKTFDVFHCLLAGGIDRAAAVKKRVPNLPQEFMKWLEVCDGGMLFDTAILCTKAHDAELDLDFETYSIYTNEDMRKEKNLADGWFVFAVAIHGDVFFYDTNKSDGQVHQWDVEENKIYASWSTFDEWLTYIISEAVALIADEELEPLDIKLELGDNG